MQRILAFARDINSRSDSGQRLVFSAASLPPTGSCARQTTQWGHIDSACRVTLLQITNVHSTTSYQPIQKKESLGKGTASHAVEKFRFSLVLKGHCFSAFVLVLKGRGFSVF